MHGNGNLNQLLEVLLSAERALGPQISYRCIEGDVISSKDLPLLFSVYNENPLVLHLQDIVESFHRVHGTVNSFFSICAFTTYSA